MRKTYIGCKKEIDAWLRLSQSSIAEETLITEETKEEFSDPGASFASPETTFQLPFSVQEMKENHAAHMKTLTTEYINRLKNPELTLE